MNRLQKIVRLIAVLALAAIGVIPVPAFAAQAAVESVEVRLISDAQGGIVLVSGTLPSGTKLPADLRLAVPTGTDILWAGEILGGDPADDPEVTYERTEGSGFDTVVMTLKEARTGQVEYRDPAAIATSGQQQTASVSWTSPVAAPKATVAVQVPQGAQVTDPGGGQLDAVTGFYTKTAENVKPGDQLEMQVVYTTTAAQPAPTQPGSPGAPGAPGTAPGTTAGEPASPITLIIAAAALVAGTLFALNAMSQKRTAASAAKPAAARRAERQADEEEGEDEDEDEEPAATRAAEPAAKATGTTTKAGGKDSAPEVTTAEATSKTAKPATKTAKATAKDGTSTKTKPPVKSPKTNPTAKKKKEQ